MQSSAAQRSLLAGISRQSNSTLNQSTLSFPVRTLSIQSFSSQQRSLSSHPITGVNPARKPRPAAAKAEYQRPPRPPARADSYQITDKVKLLASKGQLQEAADYVKSSFASNVIVWNVLIHAFLQERKFKTAYELWMDMKRRGVVPTSRSYATIFSGYGKMKEIESGALGRIKAIFAQWTVYAENKISATQMRKTISSEEVDDEISCIPTNAYLTFLGNTKNYELLLETFNAMPRSGPLAPDSMSYSTVLACLRHSEDPAHFEVAMDLWKRMSDNLMTIDVKTVSIIISYCREAVRPDDQRLGLEVAKQFYGLVDPESEDQLILGRLAAPRVAMDAAAFSNVLSLCLATQQYNLTVRWFDQVRDYPKRFGRNLLEHYHCDLTLIALANKKDAQAAEDLISWMRRSSRDLHPTLASYTCAFQVYWRAADLSRALRLVALMSGKLDSAEPASILPVLRDASSSTPTSHHRATFQPDARITSTLLQTSLSTRDRGDIYRTLEAAESYGFGSTYYSSTVTLATPLIPSSASSLPAPASTESATSKASSSSPRQISHSETSNEGLSPPPKPVHDAFWKYKLAETLERALERVLQGGDNHLSTTRRRELAIWRGTVVRWLETQEEVGKKVRAASMKGGEGSEDNMKGRREILKEIEKKREAKYEEKKKETRLAQEQEDGNRNLWRSDETRTRRSFGGEEDGRNSSVIKGSSFRRPVEDQAERTKLRQAEVGQWPSKPAAPREQDRERSDSRQSYSSYGSRTDRPERRDNYGQSSERDERNLSYSRPSEGYRSAESRSYGRSGEGSSSSPPFGRPYRFEKKVEKGIPPRREQFPRRPNFVGGGRESRY